MNAFEDRQAHNTKSTPNDLFKQIEGKVQAIFKQK